MRIKILCPDGVHYVRAFSDGTLDAIPTIVSTWELFEMEEFADGIFAIKTLASHPQPGMYVRAVGGGGGGLVADRSQANDHEKFTKAVLPGGKCVIRTHKNSYWRANNMGGAQLDCLSTTPLAWEEFTINKA